MPAKKAVRVEAVTEETLGAVLGTQRDAELQGLARGAGVALELRGERPANQSGARAWFTASVCGEGLSISMGCDDATALYTLLQNQLAGMVRAKES